MKMHEPKAHNETGRDAHRGPHDASGHAHDREPEWNALIEYARSAAAIAWNYSEGNATRLETYLQLRSAFRRCRDSESRKLSR
jgi:hypothetical protein